MENILKSNLDVLKEVSGMISVETGCNIIICDHEGEIIEATLKERIGRRHMGSILILAGESDEAIITSELEEKYKKAGTDTRAGYNYVINILDKRVGSLGVAGEPEFLKPIVRIAAKTIGFYISEYLREKEKNKILEKMAKIAEEITRKPFGEIDYQVFADDLRQISGAKYVFFDIYDSRGEMSTIVAVAAKQGDLRKISEVIGYRILGYKRHNKIIPKHNKDALTVFDSIVEFPCSLVPENRCEAFRESLQIGQVCSLEIAHEGKMLGDFILFLPEGHEIQNTLLVELYAAQVAQLLKRIQAEAALIKSEGELKKTLSILDSFWIHSPNPICILDRTGKIIRISRSVSSLLNKPARKIEGHRLTETFQPKLARFLMERLEELNVCREPVCFSDGIILANGENRYFDTWVFPILQDGEDSDLVGVVSLDVTDRIMNEERLRYLSHHDSLTGIPNRTFFEKEIKRLTVSDDYPITILSLDADGLKMINDTMGHDRGDLLLQNLAQILRGSLRDSDILARVGGDEFVILLPKAGKDIAQIIVDRIKSNIDLYNIEYPNLPINVSIGLSTVEYPGKCLEDVLKKADERMYYNKLYQKETSKTKIINSLMAALAERDYISQGHAKRLLDLTLKIGEKMKLPYQILSSLALLCQVHDLGKVSIPEAVLFKEGPLTAEEWEIMRQHPEKGYRIAMVSSPELRDIAELILEHHEWWNGRGYPLGLERDQIPVECRILAVVDAYDAMLHARPYSQAKTKEEAVKELIRCSGSQFDPEIVQLLLDILENEQKNNQNGY